MNNPEFRRNLWLSFSPHRLIGLPALLGLIFLAVALIDSFARAASLYYTAAALFIIAVWVMGGNRASAAIVDELRDKTWDQQRMSALSPWTMTWGKLFGATALGWYLGLICLPVMVFSGIAAGRADWPLDLFLLVATGILIHAFSLAVSVHAARWEMEIFQRRGMGMLGFVFAFMALQSFMFIPQIEAASAKPVLWWGMNMGSPKLFLLESVVLFMACATFGAWRLMSNALQVRTLPWAWPLFVLILTVYVGGFSDGKWFSLAGFFIATVFCYATLISEPNTPLVWNKLRLRLQAGDWHGLLAELPLWPTTFLLALVFALAAMLNWPAELTKWPRPASPAVPLAIALLLLRDAAIVLFFSFAPRARRAAGLALLYIVVLDFLLPFLFQNLGLRPVAYFFSPYSQILSGGNYGTGLIDLTLATLHAAIALGCMAWRFKKANA